VGEKLPSQGHKHKYMSDLLIRGKQGLRALHWGDIRSRVTTHEGEILSGQKGRDYMRKYSKKYLGRDLSEHGFRVDPSKVEEYEKRKK